MQNIVLFCISHLAVIEGHIFTYIEGGIFTVIILIQRYYMKVSKEEH